MTQREENFALLVASGKERTDAYLEAGYKGKDPVKQASKIANRGDVSARINEIQTREANDKNMGPAYVMEKLAFIIDKALAVVPIVDRRGEIIGEKCADLSTGHGAVRTVAQINSMLVEVKSVELSGEAKKALDRVIAAVTTEIEDPVVRERIISSLTREGPGASPG